jgi:hypothetical protein
MKLADRSRVPPAGPRGLRPENLQALGVGSVAVALAWLLDGFLLALALAVWGVWATRLARKGIVAFPIALLVCGVAGAVALKTHGTVRVLGWIVVLATAGVMEWQRERVAAASDRRRRGDER